MSPLARWRLVAAAGGVIGAALPIVAWRAGAARTERTLAERKARAVAGYVAVVARPAAGRGAGFDPRRLLVAARGVTRLPGWTTPIEVYARRTPLVSAGAALLPFDAWADLERREAALPLAGGIVVPLKDRELWDVVGAVWAAGGGAPRPAAPFTTGALLLAAALVCAWSLGRSRAARRAAVAVLAGVAVVHGWSAGRGVRQAAVWSTDRALLAARSLVQDAPVRMVGPPSRVSLAAVARVVQGTGLTLSQADSGGPGVTRTARDGAPRAALSARLGPRRWATLHTLPLEETTGAWIALCVGLALLAPLVAAVSGWGAVVLDRPRVLRETATAWTFLAPAAVHLAVFSFGPMLFALWLALHRWSPIEPVRPFVGLSNFATVASDSLVRVSLRNTVVYALYVPLTMALALAAALALNGPGRLVRWVRTAFFVPYVSSVVAVALVWQWMLNAEFGLFNWVLSAFGVGAVDWLGDRRTALLSVMLVSVWVQLGYQMTVFVAGLQAIPRTYLDAARVDGAGPWQRFWRVTFPLLRPVTLFVLVTGVIGSFQVFTFVYVLTDGGPLHATDVIVYRIYQSAWEFLRFGEASALALVLFVLLAGLTWAQFRLLGRRVEYG